MTIFRQFGEEETQVDIQFLEINIAERHDLREEGIEAGKDGTGIAAIVLLLFVQGAETIDGGIDSAVEPAVILSCLDVGRLTAEAFDKPDDDLGEGFHEL